MDVEIVGKDGKELVKGDDRDATTPADPTPLTLPRVREGESRRDTWERIRKEARAGGMSRRAAYDYATREADRLYANGMAEAPEPFFPVEPSPDPDPPAMPSPTVEPGSGLAGLGDLPSEWPVLPSNAALVAEVAWVQANRLRVRQGEGVDLSRSLSPAPSYAALSWLETSILYPAKFADVTVKASTDQQDDQADVRREKGSLVELRTLLSEAMATA